MRLFFLALLLINIAFFVWHDRFTEWLERRAPEERSISSRDEGIPSLTLLSERQTSTGKSQIGAAPVRETRTPPVARLARQCVTIGSFEDSPSAEPVRARAAEAGFAAQIIQSKREVITSYLLLIPGQYAEAEAALVVQNLKDKGIEDVAIIASGDKFAVSLGIYNRPRTMDKRRRELLAVGYAPEVQERRGIRPVVLLAVEYKDSNRAALDDFLRALSAAEPRLEWRESECD